jgi:hypothetical protein
MDTQEVQELEETAAVMADVFLERPGVHTVHLAEVPHDAGGPPYYIGPKYRLIVVVDGELAISYLFGLTCPGNVLKQDGAGAVTTSAGDVTDAVGIWTERPETPHETGFRLLGLNEDSFRESLTARGGDTQVWLDGDIDFVLLPRDWLIHIDEMHDLFRLDQSQRYPFVLFPEDEWQYAVGHYRVYNGHTRAFVAKP